MLIRLHSERGWIAHRSLFGARLRIKRPSGGEILFTGTQARTVTAALRRAILAGTYVQACRGLCAATTNKETQTAPL